MATTDVFNKNDAEYTIMSDGLDLKQFYETFFDEADELLAEMELLLLDLDASSPDIEQLNAIFRAAHSIKGGAATFGFTILTETTHLLENLLDGIRRGETALRPDMIDIFLEAKDVLKGQLDAVRTETEPDAEAYAHICGILRQLALEAQEGGAPAEVAAPAPVAPPLVSAAPALSTTSVPASALPRLRITLSRVAEKDQATLIDEIGHLGQVVAQTREAEDIVLWVDTTCSGDDIVAVCCFIIDADQIDVQQEVSAAVAAPVAACASGSGRTGCSRSA
jgi:two-component system chemotaxis sensor kinase CheA